MEISINIPIYNTQPQVIERCLQSCLNQTFTKDYEIVLYNDGSQSIETNEYLSNLHNSKIRLINSSINKGIAYGRNILFKNSYGKYCVIIDSDDIMAENRLECQYKIMEEKKPALLCNDTINNVPWYNENPNIALMYKNGFEIKQAKELIPNPICQPLVCVDKNWIIANEVWYDETFIVCNDYKFYIDVFKNGGKILLQPEKLGIYDFGHGITQARGDALLIELKKCEDLINNIDK